MEKYGCKRPGSSFSEPAWSLFCSLNVLCSNVFNIYVSWEYLTMKTMFYWVWLWLIGLVNSLFAMVCLIIIFQEIRSQSCFAYSEFLAINETLVFAWNRLLL